MYRIILGEEEIPTTERSNHLMKGKTYSDRVLATTIKNMNINKKSYG
tara:strand:+ start:92 stop:232 length:141 start_codon:yes stop_codon:yes gene_type:complete